MRRAVECGRSAGLENNREHLCRVLQIPALAAGKTFATVKPLMCCSAIPASTGCTCISCNNCKRPLRHNQSTLGFQTLDVGVVHARFPQNLLAVTANARCMAPKLHFGFLKIERAGEGRNAAFGRVFALGEETRGLQVRIFEQTLKRSHGHRRDVSFVE